MTLVTLFQIYWYQTCGGDFEAPKGVIKSPGFPSNYPKYMSCNYTIKAPEGAVVSIKFQNLTLEYSRYGEYYLY